LSDKITNHIHTVPRGTHEKILYFVDCASCNDSW